MKESTFDEFCPQCNVLVEVKVIAQGSGDLHRTEGNPIYDPDETYYRDNYSVCLCRRCNQPFLIKEIIYGAGGEFETCTEKVLLYPTESKLTPNELPKTVKSAYDQAVKSSKASLFEPCVLMCRKCLEAVCKIFKVDGHNLDTRLTKLSEAGHIDSRLLNWAHEIRLIGNEAAHDIDILVTNEDAKDVLDFTEAILIYVFSLTKRFESLRARRKKIDISRDESV